MFRAYGHFLVSRSKFSTSHDNSSLLVQVVMLYCWLNPCQVLDDVSGSVNIFWCAGVHVSNLILENSSPWNQVIMSCCWVICFSPWMLFPWVVTVTVPIPILETLIHYLDTMRSWRVPCGTLKSGGYIFTFANNTRQSKPVTINIPGA